MTITVQETLSTEDFGQQSNGLTEITREYIIVDTDGNYLTAADILATGLLPDAYEQYSGTNAVLQRRKLKPNPQNRAIWKATLTYSTSTIDIDNISSNPVNQPATISFDSMATRYAVDKFYQEGDSQGNPTGAIVNTAGDPFDPPLMDEYFNLVIQVEKNYDNFNPTDLEKYANTINDSAVTVAGVTIGEKKGWMRPLKHRTMYKDDGTPYDRIGYQIAVTDETNGWDPKIVQIGFNAVFDADFREITYDDVNGGTYDADTSKRVSSPRLLDADGGLLADGANPVFETYQTKFAISWDPLDLPSRKDGRD